MIPTPTREELAAREEFDRLDRVTYERDRFLDRATRILAGVVTGRSPTPVNRAESNEYFARWAKELTIELYWVCGLVSPNLDEDISLARANAVAQLMVHDMSESMDRAAADQIARPSKPRPLEGE